MLRYGFHISNIDDLLHLQNINQVSFNSLTASYSYLALNTRQQSQKTSDKGADYGKKERTGFYDSGSPIMEHVDNADIIDAGLLEWAIGFEYKITDKLLASVGYLGTKTGVKDEYHTDLSYSNSSHSFGLGGKYLITENNL